MAESKKQQNTKRIPPTKQTYSQNYDIIAMEDLTIKGMFKNKRWAPKLQKISLYKPRANDKIQIQMVRKNIHTNQSLLSIQPNMQRMQISKTRPNNRHTRMDLPIM